MFYECSREDMQNVLFRLALINVFPEVSKTDYLVGHTARFSHNGGTVAYIQVFDNRSWCYYDRDFVNVLEESYAKRIEQEKKPRGICVMPGDDGGLVATDFIGGGS